MISNQPFDIFSLILNQYNFKVIPAPATAPTIIARIAIALPGSIYPEIVGIEKLINIKDLKNEDLAKKIGKSSSHISNLIRILELDGEIHQMIIDGKITMGNARALIGVPNAVEKAKEIFERNFFFWLLIGVNVLA